jgi:hypothetical protein
MKKIIIFVILAVCTVGVLTLSAFDNKPKDVVGYLDGQPVKMTEIENYVDTLLGTAYLGKLKSEEGLKELFNNYVNRKLILDHARKEIKDDNSFVKHHTMGEIDEDSAKISALLKQEINDKVEITKEELDKFYTESGKFKTIDEAERNLISMKRVNLFNKFITKLRAEHKISFNS